MRIVVTFLIACFAIAPTYAQSFERQLQTLVAEYTDEHDPAVVVQVSTPEATWTVARGLADEQTPAQPDDRFRVGSMSKTFVAVAALMMEEDRLFDLDDPAQRWLDDALVANIANLEVVTSRQLLSMRSGIDDYLGTDEFWSAVFANPARVWTAREALEYAFGLPALFAPDDSFYYSNTNYLLMQEVMEAASGLPLHEIIRTQILDPLSMHNTYTQVSEELPSGFVRGYGDLDENGTLEDLTDINDGAGLGDGGLISNAEDLTTFYEALFRTKTLLQNGSMSALLKFRDAGDGSGYSLGLNEWKESDTVAWGHSGGVLGFLSIGLYLPDMETTIIILSASANFSHEDLALEIISILEVT